MTSRQEISHDVDDGRLWCESQADERRLCGLVARALGLAGVAGAKGAIRIASANEPLTRRPILQNSKSLWM